MITNFNDKLGKCTKSHVSKNRTSNGTSVQCSYTVDFTGCTINELLDWGLSNRVIAGQRPWEKLSPAEMMDMVDKGTFHAKTIGQKVVSNEEKMRVAQEFINSLDPEIATQMLKDVIATKDESEKDQ